LRNIVKMKLSIIIPAHNEEGSITETISSLYKILQTNNIEHEILVVNDNSKDTTEKILKELQAHVPTLVYHNNTGANGFGYAVRFGLTKFAGDCVAIMMADLSDSPDDLVKFYYKLAEGYDCVFGNRWGKDGQVVNYPPVKKFLNRLANYIVKITFGLKYGDCTNAFKLYRRETIEGLKPFLAPHFNLTLELPLKAIVRGYSYAIVPNSWRNRQTGESKLIVKEMGSRYFFILLYCLIEKYFARGDFLKKN
jgi:dolichol-phosphate mannosyltransferase